MNAETNFIGILLLASACGCNPPPSEPLSGPTAVSAGRSEITFSAEESGQTLVPLHDDAVIEDLVPYEIGELFRLTRFEKPPHLGVVPAGETKKRKDVFSELGLSEDRIANLELRVMNGVLHLSWQISPSYYINCMTDYSEVKIDESIFDRMANDDALRDKLSNPNKMVYGVRILSHRLP